MKIGLDSFLEGQPDQGSLVRLEGIGSGQAASPWVAVVGQACLIGPLTVYAAPGSRLHTLDLEDGTVIADFASGPKFSSAWDSFKKEAGNLYRGTFLALHNYRSYNFWHWTMESLIKLLEAQLAGFRGKIIVPASLPQNRFVAESLDMLGIAPERILPYDGKAWWVEELFVPQPIDGYSSLRWYPDLFFRLRRTLLAAADISGPPLRLYISRRRAREGRRIINEEQLVGILKDFGFQTVVMENLPLQQQISLAARADCLLGPHGAGMIHSFFMPRASMVLELFPQDYVNPCILPVVDLLGHRYFMYPSATFQDDDKNDIEAPIYAVELTLRRELTGMRSRQAVAQILSGRNCRAVGLRR